MTRFEVNFLLFLGCSACIDGSGSFGAVLFGLLSMWFALRAIFPKIDQWAGDGEASPNE